MVFTLNKDLKYRILRKIDQARCHFILRKQRKGLNRSDIGYLTIFHDYESHYALANANKSSDYGIKFILDVEKEYNIKGTYNIVGKLIKELPEIVLRIVSDGHELASHSYDHRIMADLSKNEVRNDILKTKILFESIGVRLSGFRSPQCKWSFRQMHVLLEEELSWSAERDNAKFPYVLLKNNNNLLLRIPTVMDDWEYKSKNINPDIMLKNLISKVDSIAKQKVYGGIGFHPWIQGEDDQRLRVFQKFIEIISNRKDIRILSFGEMRDMFMKFYTKQHI